MRLFMLFRRIISPILFGFVLYTSAFAQVTGTFSSLKLHKESGDLVGIEVFVFIGAADDYMVLYQESLGEAIKPSLVTAKFDGNNIEFTVPDLFGGQRTFKGKITKTNMVGGWVGSKETIKLPRRNSFWQ